MNVTSSIVLDCCVSLLHEVAVSCRIVYIAVTLFSRLFLHIYDGFTFIIIIINIININIY
jgi:hypothetical protein